MAFSRIEPTEPEATLEAQDDEGNGSLVKKEPSTSAPSEDQTSVCPAWSAESEPSGSSGADFLAKEMVERVPSDHGYARRSWEQGEMQLKREEALERECEQKMEGEPQKPKHAWEGNGWLKHDSDSSDSQDSSRANMSDVEYMRRNLLMRASHTDKSSSEDGSLRWQGDGTPSDQGDESIREAVRQLAQRYEGPREFWTEYSLPAITKDSLPSCYTRDQLPTMTAESLPSYNPTREHLPLMSVGRGFQEDEHEDKETSHPTSPSSEDENNSKDCLSFDKTDEKHHLRFKRFRRVRSLYASKESLPTIMSESCEDSEVGSLPPGSRSASRMNSMPVSRSCTRDSLPEFEPYSGGFKARTTTKDSLPPIGDVMETETEEETTDEDNTSAAPDGTAADPKPDDANLNANDVRSALRQAYTQIVTLKAEMAELRRNNADLKHENKVLRTLAAQADVLNNLSGVANKPKDRSNHKDKGRVTISTATIVEVPQTEPPEEVAGPVEDTPTALLATARERWSQRRQERRERRSSNTDGKMSYRRWLQDQHEQVLDLDSRRTSTSTEDGASCPGVTGPPLPEAPEGHPASSAPPRCGAALPG